MAYFIGITGASGTGKTTFLRKLTEGFGSDKLCVVSQDNYYLPREQQVQDHVGKENFDLPSSIDHVRMLADLKKLAAGEAITLKEYTFNNKDADAKDVVMNPAPIIVVEGLFVMHYPEMREMFDLKLFLHAREHLALKRRIIRDQVERNYPLDDVLYRYEYHVMPAFDLYIKPYMDEADLVIHNNTKGFDQALAVLRAFVGNYK